MGWGGGGYAGVRRNGTTQSWKPERERGVYEGISDSLSAVRTGEKNGLQRSISSDERKREKWLHFQTSSTVVGGRPEHCGTEASCSP